MSTASSKSKLSSEIEKRFRLIYADLKVDADEFASIVAFFKSINPPPSAILWCRSTAFRIASEFVTLGADGDRDKSLRLLKCVNSIVHAIETTYLVPRNRTLKFSDDGSPFPGDAIEEHFRDCYADLDVDEEEREGLMEIFVDVAAFRIGSEFLTGEKEKDVAVFKCVNAVVHALEKTSMTPRPAKRETGPPENTIKTMNMRVPLSEAIQAIWDLDDNRLEAGKDYDIEVQRWTRVYDTTDQASRPLFRKVNDAILRERETFKTFIALLDNYESEVGVAERVDMHERKENWAFIASIMKTAPMQYCFRYCAAHCDKVSLSDPSGFTKLLYKLWFDLYNRSRAKDSSGFEHVFVGEVKNGEVTGFHNWIQFYLAEKKGEVDYKGYIQPRARGRQASTNMDDNVLTVKFNWNGAEKAVGTMFIGTSPEFEMALYTMCFLVGKEDTNVDLVTGTDEFILNIKCYRMRGNLLGTSFPECLEHHEK
eukprot:CAMPEP_0113329430 /NCGR_PEP_ID=MMETSP0010_2-20120614/20903_1 /TAXON_ID=216773 ORGANISM="Corethron hystrix, Strain 308" /NCGR_SAMPLE_ID=MMETSP0010_2 /ASSEMBLY_ACC=CAM_ASM_000155 /LENGTH=480 /DNA_ID=CAMNT_0000191533 /DNA_START=94 /DNA_END=1536 /DNA_ORIENTATION=- /assembly_acc=CAM_ASM_000155